MSEPRFYVQRFAGYPIPLRDHHAARHLRVSWYVFDRLYQHAVVAEFSKTEKGTGVPQATLRQRAERECARLNAEWQDELHSDARR